MIFLTKIKSLSKQFKTFFFPIFLTFIVLIFLLAREIFTSHVSNVATVGFTVSVKEYPRNVFLNYTVSPLLRGKKLKGEFKAADNHLGMILIRFYNFGKVNSDIISFRIKEKGKKSWYFKHNYTVGQFQPNEYFTFGIPVINNSKDKIYIFQLESVNGKQGDAIAISKESPQFATAYQFSSEEILGNLRIFFRFFYRKILFSLKWVNLSIPLKLFFLSFFIIFLQKIDKKDLLIVNKIFIKSLHNLNKIIKQHVVLEQKLIFLKRRLIVYKNLTQKVIKHLSKLFIAHKQKLIFLCVLIIIVIAAICRIGFYSQNDFLNTRFFSGLGSNNDNDVMIKDSIAYLVDPINSFKRSLLNDNPFLVRFFSLFFKIFGFVNGLNRISYVLIILGTIVSLLPYLILSDGFKKFTFGGFLSSLFIAVNPQIVANSVALPVDAVTNFFFMFVIIFYFAALRRKNYLIAIFLGIFAFIDGFNRGIMFINHFPSLFIFAFFYIYLVNKKKKLKKEEILYAFVPFVNLAIMYILFEVWHYKLFNELWFFAPKIIKNGGFLFKFSSEYAKTSTPNTIFSALLSKNLWLLFLRKANSVLYMFKELIHIPMLLLAMPFAALVFLKRYKIYKFFKVALLVYFLVLIYAWFILLFVYPSRQFLTHQEINIAEIFLLLSLLFAQIAYLKTKFLTPVFLIGFYVLMLIWGFHATFSARHFNQVLLVFFVGFGIFIDVLYKDIKKENKFSISKIFFIIFALGSLLYIKSQLILGFSRVIAGINYSVKEVKYIKYADSIIPKNGIILTGIQNEDFTLIYNNSMKTIAYLKFNPFLLPQKKNFSFKALNYVVESGNNIKFGREIEPMLGNSNYIAFDFPSIISDPKRFYKYNFYLLDYDKQSIISYFKIRKRNKTGKIRNSFLLQKIGSYQNKRNIYKLNYIQ